jgi:predicted nucleic acid-binding protein
MANVYWDTMLYVYWLDNHVQLGPRVEAIRRGMSRRGDRLCASVLTLGELLVTPVRDGDTSAAARIDAYLTGPEVTILPLTLEAGRRFAEIRATTAIASADALHLAVAASAGVDLFLTNDLRLARHTVPGIDFIATLDAGLY